MIAEVEKEYKEKIKNERPFEVPEFRTGDVLDVTMFRSLSEGKLNKHRGICIGVKKRNHLSKAFHMYINEADTNLSIMVMENSPMVAKIDVHKYGSNKLRSKLYHIRDLELTKARS